MIAAFSPECGPALTTVRFPAGRPLPQTAAELGLEAHLVAGGVVVRAGRLAHDVRVHAAGCVADEAGFTLEPGAQRLVALEPQDGCGKPVRATVRAGNLEGVVLVSAAQSP